MGSIRHDLLALEDASVDELSNLMMADTKLCCGIAKRQPLAIFLGGAVAMDITNAAHKADALRRPILTMASRHSHSVQSRGDVLIRPSARHAPHDLNRLFRSLTPVLTGSPFTDAQLGMLTTPPVDDEHNLASCLIDIGNDLCD
jgi:hypothetical protein